MWEGSKERAVKEGKTGGERRIEREIGEKRRKESSKENIEDGIK